MTRLGSIDAASADKEVSEAGRTPGPGCEECSGPQAAPGGLPLAPRLSEGLGRISTRPLNRKNDLRCLKTDQLS